jgi:hypothetical protein
MFTWPPQGCVEYQPVPRTVKMSVVDPWSGETLTVGWPGREGEDGLARVVAGRGGVAVGGCPGVEVLAIGGVAALEGPAAVSAPSRGWCPEPRTCTPSVAAVTITATAPTRAWTRLRGGANIRSQAARSASAAGRFAWSIQAPYAARSAGTVGPVRSSADTGDAQPPRSPSMSRDAVRTPTTARRVGQTSGAPDSPGAAWPPLSRR